MSCSRIQALLIRPQGQFRELFRASIAEPRFESQFCACLILFITESLSLILSIYTTKLRVPPFQNHMGTTNFSLPCLKHMFRNRLNHFLVYPCPGIVTDLNDSRVLGSQVRATKHHCMKPFDIVPL